MSHLGRRTGSSFRMWPLLIALQQVTGSELPAIPEIEMDKLSLGARPGIETSRSRLIANPLDPALNGDLAMRLHAYELYGQAESLYTRASRLVPGTLKWTYLLGVVQGLQGNSGESVETLREALRIRPGFFPGRVRLAEALLDSDRIDEASSLFEDLLKLSPDNPLVLYGLGRVRLAEKRIEDAVDPLSKACLIAPTFGPAHYSLALAYRDLGERDQARRHLEVYRENQNRWPPSGDPFLLEVRALKIGPREHLAVGVRLAEQGRTEEAIREHERSLELYPSLVQAHIHLIRLFAEVGDLEKAERHYLEAVRLNENLFDVHYNYAVLLDLQGRYQEAAESYRKALNINPNNPQAANNLGLNLQMAGKIRESKELFRRAISNNPGYRTARFNLGRSLIALGDLAGAIEQFQKTLEPEDERTPRFMYALAAAYARAGDAQKALPLAEEAMKRAGEFGQRELEEQIQADVAKLRRGQAKP